MIRNQMIYSATSRPINTHRFKTLYIQEDLRMNNDSDQQLRVSLIDHVDKEEDKNSKPQEPPAIPPAPFLSLFRYTTPSERIKLVFGSIASLVAGAAMPFFLIYFADITKVFDERERESSAQKGWQLCYKLFIVGGVTWVTYFLGTYYWNVVGGAQAVRIKKLYYQTLLQQEVAWYDQNDPNKLVTKVTTNITHIQAATGQKISLLLSTIVTSFAAIFFAFFKCWELSAMLLTALPALLITGVLFMKAFMLNAQRQKVSYQKASSRTEQALGQIRNLKSMVGEEHQLQKFEASLQEGQKTSVKYCVFTSISHGLLLTIFLSLYAFGFWYGKKLIIDNLETQKYNAADILGAFFCFLIGGTSFSQLSPYMKNIAQGRVAMAEFYDLLHREKTLQEPKEGTKVKEIGKIALNNVNFHYKCDQPVLKNINISFTEGKVSALVGESGCGKSTIVQLLMRYYDPTSGQLLINTQNLKDVNMNNFRRKVGFVGQQPVLFAMSIAQNLKLADPSLTEEDMISVLKKANAWQFVEKMEKKLDTYVGSGGTQLSGGQKQRIAIARAICKKPQVLILDEATSALDRKNEREIQQTLKSLQKNKITTIVIAHRLSTIKDADRIYVLKKGQVVQEGTHEELLQTGNVYADLVKTQIAATKHIGQQQGEKGGESVNQSQANNQQQSLVVKKQEKEQIPKQKQDAVFRKLMAYEKSNCFLLIIGLIAALGAGLVFPLFNFIFSGILEMMMNPLLNDSELNAYCLYMAIIAFSAGLLIFIYSLCFGIASDKLVYRIRITMFKKLMKLPVSYYDRPENTAGGINSKLATDAYQIRNMVSGILGVMSLNIATISASLAFGLYYSWKVTLISLALSPLIVVVGSINMKVIMRFTTKSQQTQKVLGSLMSDSVCNIRTVKSFGRPQAFVNEFGKKLDQLNEVNVQKHFTTGVLTGMSRAMIMIVEGIIFYLAALLFQSGQVETSRAVFTAVMSVIFAAMGLGQNSQFMPDMAKSKVSGAGVFDIIQSKDQEELSLENGGTLVEDLNGSIEFRNVTFKYPQRQKVVLQNLSFKIEKGKFALVGHSGSGKSTIIQLLLRFYEPTSGQILLNGRNIKEFDLYALRRKFGLVSQQPALFIGSVQDNIRYNSGCSQQDLTAATQVAHAQKFIQEWEEGLQKDVGQKGGQVSGGQKQRIALSRCLVRKPKLFLFDEFTSALDADTEKIVFENLKPILSQKTSISVAHRLSTIQDANRILVFKDGQIIESGTFQELMELRNHFYSLAKGQ